MNNDSASIITNPYPLGEVFTIPYNSGTPPKEYGQYLQATGKQKWSKPKKRR